MTSTQLAADPAGLSREELVEVATHLAFYAGWPTAASALQLLQNLNAPQDA